MTENMHNRKIKDIPYDEFQELLNTSNSYKDILQKLNYQTNNGNNFNTIKRRIRLENFDTTLLDINRKELQNIQTTLLRTNNEKRIEDIFIENSSSTPSVVRKKLLKYKLLEYKCAICANYGEHLNNPLTLQMDHINGINNDHRIENLRWLCPNCHSQTDTYSNKKRKYRTCACGNNIITKRAKKCARCQRASIPPPTTKINWISDEELKLLIESIPMLQIGKRLGVSDNAVRKRCISRGIEYPKRGRGYWTPRSSS